MKNTDHFDIIIAGGGLAGLTMANALIHNSGNNQTKEKFKVALISPTI